MEQRIIKGKNWDGDAGQERYLQMCARLTVAERIELLEKLNTKIYDFFYSNPDNHRLIQQKDGKQSRLQGLSKSIRTI